LKGVAWATPFAFVQKLSTLVAPSPSEVWVFAEKNLAGSGEPVLGFYITQTQPHTFWGDIPTDRHSKGCNFSFADGHADYHSWKAPKDIHPKPQILPGGDRKDYDWLLNGEPRLY
jgi:prepilin-type processing-associated H-X9-DG protein